MKTHLAKRGNAFGIQIITTNHKDMHTKTKHEEKMWIRIQYSPSVSPSDCQCVRVCVCVCVYVYLFANYDFASFAMPLFFMCCIFLRSSIQFNAAVYEPHSFVLYSVSNTSTHNTNKRTDINTYAHIHIHSLAHSHTHIRSFERTLTHTLACLFARSPPLFRSLRRLRALSSAIACSLSLTHTLIGYTYALHINRLLLILFIIFSIWNSLFFISIFFFFLCVFPFSVNQNIS